MISANADFSVNLDDDGVVTLSGRDSGEFTKAEAMQLAYMIFAVISAAQIEFQDHGTR